MWQILHASFWKFSKLSNSGISLHRSIIGKVTTEIQQHTFLAHSVDHFGDKQWWHQLWAKRLKPLPPTTKSGWSPQILLNILRFVNSLLLLA